MSSDVEREYIGNSILAQILDLIFIFETEAKQKT